MQEDKDQRELRVAVVMGGGVSLGSFSSGALYQLLAALEDEQRAGRRVCLDVAAGASAGAMTLAVLFRYLYAGASLRRIREALYECWVDGVGMDGEALDQQLLPELRFHKSPSLLSDRPLEHLARRHLLEYAGQGPRQEHCTLLAPKVYLSFSLTNLHGLRVRAPSKWADSENHKAGEDALASTLFEDKIRFRLQRQAQWWDKVVDPSDASRPMCGLDPERWQVLLDAALASGAFPGVFPPRKIRRYAQEYPLITASQFGAAQFGPQGRVFSYVDGGLFANEPLKEALNLANELDGSDDPRDYERRFYFIDPVVSGSEAKRVLPHELPRAWTSTYDQGRERYSYTRKGSDQRAKLRFYLARVKDALFGQASFRDWQQVGKTNRRVEWAEAFLDIMAPSLSQLALDSSAKKALTELLEEIYRGQDSCTPARVGEGPACPSSTLERDQARAQRLLRERCPDASAQQCEQGAMIKVALDQIADLRAKRDVQVVAISPWSGQDSPVRLAGEFAGAFGGFFKKSWRAHDFHAGEKIAHSVLQRPGTLTFEEQEASDSAASAHYDEVEPQVRERFESVIHDHLERMLGELGVPEMADHALAWGIRRSLMARFRSRASNDIRPIVVKIIGRPLQALHALWGLDKEHQISAFGDPPRIVTMIEAVFDPYAAKGERYHLHGPELVDCDGHWEFRLDASSLPAAEHAQRSIVLSAAAELWYRHARDRPWLVIDWSGEEGQEVRPCHLRAEG